MTYSYSGSAALTASAMTDFPVIRHGVARLFHGLPICAQNTSLNIRNQGHVAFSVQCSGLVDLTSLAQVAVSQLLLPTTASPVGETAYRKQTNDDKQRDQNRLEIRTWLSVIADAGCFGLPTHG